MGMRAACLCQDLLAEDGGGAGEERRMLLTRDIETGKLLFLKIRPL